MPKTIHTPSSFNSKVGNKNYPRIALLNSIIFDYPQMTGALSKFFHSFFVVITRIRLCDRAPHNNERFRESSFERREQVSDLNEIN